MNTKTKPMATDLHGLWHLLGEAQELHPGVTVAEFMRLYARGSYMSAARWLPAIWDADDLSRCDNCGAHEGDVDLLVSENIEGLYCSDCEAAHYAE
jgi:hypothetical protein